MCVPQAFLLTQDLSRTRMVVWTEQPTLAQDPFFMANKQWVEVSPHQTLGELRFSMSKTPWWVSVLYRMTCAWKN